MPRSLTVGLLNELRSQAASLGLGAVLRQDLGWLELRSPYRFAEVLELPFPIIGVAIEGVGRFEFEYSAQTGFDLKRFLENVASQPGAMVSSSLRSVRNSLASVGIVGLAERADSWEVVQRDVAAFESFYSTLMRWARVAGPGLRFIGLPYFRRVAILNRSDAILRFEQISHSLAQWSLDPVSDSELELDFRVEGDFIAGMLAAFAAQTVSITERASFLGRSLHVQFSLPGRAGYAVVTASASSEPGFSEEDYPWVFWRSCD